MIVYLTTNDIRKITGCSRTTAQKHKVEVIKYSSGKGIHSVSNRVCLARHFGEMFGVTQKEMEEALKKTVD